MERTIATIAFEGACESLKHSTDTLDLSVVKKIILKVELEDGQFCTVFSSGKEIAENIRQYHAMRNRQLYVRPHFWAKLKYLFTGK